MNIAIIGAGTIGAEVYKQALRQNWTIQYIVRRDGIYRNLKDKIDELANLARQNKVDLVFVAVPSNKQTSSYRYFHMYLQRGIPIVTAEKSALAHYFFKLRPYLDKIGYSATVGGGSRMIQYLESFPQQQIKTVQAVISGTLNFIFDQLDGNRDLQTAIAMAQKLGLTEPGTINPIQLINREINDVQLKTTILLNLLNKDSLAILPSQIKIQRIDQQQLTKLIEIRNIRLIVSIEKRGNHWQATISFQKLTPSSSLLVPGVNNALIINQKYGICGPGAGPVPTVRVMIEDAIHLCPN